MHTVRISIKITQAAWKDFAERERNRLWAFTTVRKQPGDIWEFEVDADVALRLIRDAHGRSRDLVDVIGLRILRRAFWAACELWPSEYQLEQADMNIDDARVFRGDTHYRPI